MSGRTVLKGTGMQLASGSGARMEAVAAGFGAGRVRVSGLAGWLLEAGARVLGRGGAGRRKEMRVVETLTIGAKKQLVLVSCGGERFLVGTGADSVGTIVRVGAEAGGAAAEFMDAEDGR